MFVKKNIMGVGFSDVTYNQVLEFLLQNFEKNNKKTFIVTPNPEILIMAWKLKAYNKILNSADLALADGAGVIWAGRMLGNPLKERIAGVDLMENLCRDIAKRPVTAAFLGGGPKIADRAAECLRKRYPSLKIVFVGQNPPKNMAKLTSDILFVAFGSPKQEIWIAKHLEQLPVKAAIGVGGAFDFASGEVKRAPKLIRDLGLEWLFRLAIQPWRFKRQLSLLTFSFLVLKKRFARAS